MVNLTNKQCQALGYLHPKSPVKYPFYGGAAGGGKTWMGCFWLNTMCIRYPGTRWFIGRDSLKDSRESVLVTWSKVSKTYGLTGWKSRDNEIVFSNGSHISFIDLSYYPQKDPFFERFGSKEYTGGWIEEGGEIHFAAFDTLKSRVGRHMNAEYEINSKILITGNPKKNWLHTIFWHPFKTGKLPPEYAFIRALYTDNPHLPKEYIENLEQITDKVKRERLLKGNFDYDDNPNALCAYDDIMGIFGANQVNETNVKYITADIARFGSDRAVIVVWDGWIVIDYRIFDVSKTTDIQTSINHYMKKYQIPRDRAIADEDGVGGGVVDNCKIKGFVNNSKALKDEKYNNLQSQCAYKLAEIINSRAILFQAYVTEEEKEIISMDLEQLQTWKPDNDKVLMIKPKEEIKKDIGRSPDWRDAMLMRAWFEYNNKTTDMTAIYNAFKI